MYMYMPYMLATLNCRLNTAQIQRSIVLLVLTEAPAIWQRMLLSVCVLSVSLELIVGVSVCVSHPPSLPPSLIAFPLNYFVFVLKYDRSCNSATVSLI